MKTMKKTIMLCLLGIITAGTTLSAQNQKPQAPSAEQMMEKKWEFIAQKVEIAPEIRPQIEKLFKEYETSTFSLNKKCMQKKRAIKKQENLTEDDYKQLNQLMLQSEEKRKEFFMNYYHNLENLLSQKQLFHYFEAEKHFKRSLFGPKHKGEAHKHPRPATPQEE